LFAFPHLQTGVVLSGAPSNQQNPSSPLVITMTSPTNTMHKMSFVLKDLVAVHVGHLFASLYPKIKPSMPVFERAHAFQVSKSALKALPVDTHLLLNAMGTQFNCSTIFDGLVHDWYGLFYTAWFTLRLPPSMIQQAL
jgi:hypothetical protein